MTDDLGRRVLEIEADALREVAGRLGKDTAFADAVEALRRCKGRVVVTGMGKSGLICRKIAATLASTGTPALFLHPAEALHGDLGVVTDEDLVLAASNSGETPEILSLLERIRRLGVVLVSLVGRPDSTLARESDVFLDVSVSREACPLGLAPTASTTATLAVGDALAMALLERRGFTSKDFAERHPGGALGRKILRVADVMRTGDEVPRVGVDATLGEAVQEMSAKGLGLTTLVDAAGRPAGILTDGDLRRALQRGDGGSPGFLEHPARGHASFPPRTIRPEALATEALRVLEEKKIMALVVVDGEGQLAGVVQFHHLWRTQMF